ncbi:hypothetical protein AN641_06405 [Candidatus Epulonipiscioides gigas]|nr:hypothetical protein AN641_08985 [Epulopiscium sp. SCG-C07WGA-EpuloA2]ONI44614.1 hypothetical protein AN641_06405 [Epulopiscium sp. SCG-C07WGA-EpuloA2]
MSMPNIPNISPKIEIDIQDTISLLLSSIAQEQVAIANFTTSHAETLKVLNKKYANGEITHEQYLKACNLAKQTLKDITAKDWLLTNKIDNILEIIEIYPKPNENCSNEKCCFNKPQPRPSRCCCCSSEKFKECSTYFGRNV